jgi:hypothetical protein
MSCPAILAYRRLGGQQHRRAPRPRVDLVWWRPRRDHDDTAVIRRSWIRKGAIAADRVRSEEPSPPGGETYGTTAGWRERKIRGPVPAEMSPQCPGCDWR